MNVAIIFTDGTVYAPLPNTYYVTPSNKSIAQLEGVWSSGTTILKYEECGITYLKNSTNFVFAPNFLDDIRRMKSLEEVILNGCLTDICIKNGAITLRNLFDQENRNIKVIVDESGIDTYDSSLHNREEESRRALTDMKNNGIEIVKKYGGK